MRDLADPELGGKLVFTSRIARPLRDVVGGLFSLFVAFVLTSFYGKAMDGAGRTCVLRELAVMVVTSALSFFLPRRRAPKPMPAIRGEEILVLLVSPS